MSNLISRHLKGCPHYIDAERNIFLLADEDSYDGCTCLKNFVPQSEFDRVNAEADIAMATVESEFDRVSTEADVAMATVGRHTSELISFVEDATGAAPLSRVEALGRITMLGDEVKRLKERERDICKAVGGVSDGGQYRNDIIEHLTLLSLKAARADALEVGIRKVVAPLLAACEHLSLATPDRVLRGVLDRTVRAGWSALAALGFPKKRGVVP